MPHPFADFPLADADQCVKCALCLPHCPTYKLSQHEGDSPRGRIALLQGLAQGVIQPKGSALAHLDGCLVCRACEPVCPAQVPYGRIIDAGRKGLWRAKHRPAWWWRALAWWRRTPRRLRWLNEFFHAMDRSGAAKLLAALPLGRLARASRFLDTTGKPPAPRNGAPSPGVALFLGCVARSLDAAALNSAQQVLRAMGFQVRVPDAQTCCGAMDAHAGDAMTLQRLAQRNVRAFAGTDEAVISTASGCGVQLQDYREIEPGNDSLNAFATRVHDVMHFVAANIRHLPALHHAPARVVVHAPCTLKNGMRESGAADVLTRITGLSVAVLRHHDCCGAAGTYLFEHPATADALGRRLLDALDDNIPDFLATSNIGCALHLRALAAERGLKLRVVHPVELVAAALPTVKDTGI